MRTHFLPKIFILLGLFFVQSLKADESSHTLLDQNRLLAANDFYQKQIKPDQAQSSSKLEKLERKVNAKQAFDSQDWYGSRYALQRVLADNENDFQAWYMLAKSLIELQQHDTYQNYDQALEASLVKAYATAKAPLDYKAVELLAASSRLAFSDLKEKALKEAKQSDIDNHIQTLLNNYPKEFAPYFLDIPQKTDLASACILWTHPLAKSRQLHYEDFVKISPTVKDKSIIARKNQLCIEGLAFGENYQLTFKKGLKGEENYSLQEDQTLSVFIPHRKAAISFREKGYILASTAPQLIPLTAVNVSEVKVKIIHIPERNIQRVQSNWFSNSISRWEVDSLQEEDGDLVWEGTYRFPVETDKTTVSGLPIDKMMGKQLLPGVYVVQAYVSDQGYDENEFSSQALVISDIGLSTYQGPDGLHVFARSLESAKALSGVEVSLIARNNKELGKIKTQKNGHATFNEKIINGKGGNTPAFISASSQGKQFTVLNLRNEPFNLEDRGDEGRDANNTTDGYLFTERGIYRPGETVHHVCLLRDKEGQALKQHPLTLKLFRPDGVLAEQLVLQDKGNGAYLYDYAINGSAQSGVWTAAIYLDPKGAQLNYVTFEVNDFVPPRIEVKTTSSSPQVKPFEQATIDVLAQYYYGPFAANLRVEGQAKLVVSAEPFAKYKDYHFGLEEEKWTPQIFKLPETKTNNEGKASLSLQIDVIPQTTQPLQIETYVNVFEVGGRARKTKLLTSFWHQPYLIGIAPLFKDNVANSNADAVFKVIALNEKGELQNAASLKFTLFEEQHDYVWYRQGSQWQYDLVTRDKVIQTGTLTLEGKQPTELKIPLKYGPYRIEIIDDKTGVATSYRFSSGWYYSTETPDKPDMLEIALDEKSLKDNRAKVHLKSPFKGELFLAWAGEKFTPIYQDKIGTEPVTLTIPVSNPPTSGQYLVATVFAPQNDALAQVPKRAIGITYAENKQEKLKHEINFSIEHPEKVQSGKSFSITLKTEKPTQDLRYTVALVDEGTLSLTDFNSPSPFDYFFAQTKLNYALRDSYGYLINPYGVKPGSFDVGGGGSIMAKALTQLPARAFKVVALFSGVVESNGKNTITVPFTLPEYTGKLRVMVVAWNETSLGEAQSSLLVQDPLDVYLALPRFLAPEDEATIPLMLKVIDAPQGSYTVTYRTQNNEQKQQVTLKKDQELQIPLTVGFKESGVKNNVIDIQGPNGFNLKRTWELSVRPKVQTISLHQYHKLDPNQSVSFTPELLKDFQTNNSQVTLSVGSIPEVGAKSHINDLLQYPYYCLEQTTSRLLAGMLSNEAEALLQKGYNQLTTLQKMDGSFSLWSQNGQTEPWLSLYAYDVLLLGKEKGAKVPDAMLANLSRWALEAKDRTINAQEDISIVAYAHYLLAKEHKGTLRQLRFFADNQAKAITQRHDMAFIAAAFAYYDSPNDAKLWFDKAIAVAPQPKENYYTGFGSELRNDAILLTMMAQTTKQHPQLITLAQTLVDKSKESVYLSTQEKAWVARASHALKDARKTYHVQLDAKPIEGTLTHNVDLTQAALTKNPVLKNVGKETVYYALTLHGEPKDVKTLPQKGFELTRTVYTLDGQEADLNNIHSGERYVVLLRGKKQVENLNHILLVDLLPAGFEIDNAKLALDNLETLHWLGPLTIASRFEGRDDRFMAAFELQAQSEFSAAFMVRAVSAGSFAYPPAFVEAMYQPQFFCYTDEQKIAVIK